MAASFIRLASEAPEKPIVRLATMSSCTSSAMGLPRECTLRMARRPSLSGRSTGTRRSKRPGRSSAESSTSARLVAAMTMTPALPSKPSISVRIWLSVCSRSSLPPPMPPRLPPARCRPTASISSIKTMHGAFFFASEKSERMRAAPTPTNISTNSDPEHEMKGTPASPATARASSVLPVPGGPSISTPRGTLAPSAEYLSGFFKKSTTSSSSSLEASQPATSANVTPVSGSIAMSLLAFANAPGPPVGASPPRERRTSPPMRSSVGNSATSASAMPLDASAASATSKRTSALRRRSIRSDASKIAVS
mmetsp:Transcript_50519/g.109532  ORF Transcript_50519/g.109532 Transcript_50519/m.109532 type:complete len:308 (-) Transcript_50519:499-1422(-)